MSRVETLAQILVENYSLGELEERFDATSEQLYDGFEDYVEHNFKRVKEVLREDLFDLDGD